MSSNIPGSAPERNAPKWTAQRLAMTAAKILLWLIGGYAVLYVLGYIISGVGGVFDYAIQYIVAFISVPLVGIFDALDASDFVTWYFTERAQIQVHPPANELLRPEYCDIIPGPRSYHCKGWNSGASAAVDLWNAVMAHQAARLILLFLFPIFVTAFAKKLIDELWDKAKTKKKADQK